MGIVVCVCLLTQRTFHWVSLDTFYWSLVKEFPWHKYHQNSPESQNGQSFALSSCSEGSPWHWSLWPQCPRELIVSAQEAFVGFELASASFQRRQWHPTPVLLPGKSQGRRSLVGCSPWGREESDTTERLHFHFSLSCIGEGNGNPLRCSCLENPKDGGAWWAAAYGVAQSWTRLKRLSSSSFFSEQET